jgi:hypothetical protein
MPYRDADPSDPSILVGVSLPADAEAIRTMAEVFAEEFARLGHSREQILRLFQRPFYAGAHQAYRQLGAPAIEAIVDQSLAVWGGVRYVDHDLPEPRTAIRRRDCGDGLSLLEPDPAARRA